jgi:diguanylate cyclase
VLDIEASVGIAWSPEHGDDVTALLRRADSAMYAAKARKEGVVTYRAEDDQLAPMHLSMLGDLRRALESPGQLQAWFQPIIALSDTRLAGAEALVRWEHPTRGRVHPADFIPMAEGTALIHQLTDHVLDDALASMARWPSASPELRLSVNLSPRNLLDSSLSARVESLLSRHGTDPSRVRLEITESAVLADPARAVATMHRLTALGVGLSIDDFGTGFSSMSHLKNLPVDQIKIDRSFVTDMLRSPQDLVMVRSIIDLAHGLGMHVVAEGVEDSATLGELRRLGCDLAQGYHIGYPVDRATFQALAQGGALPSPRGRDATALPDVLPVASIQVTAE